MIRCAVVTDTPQIVALEHDIFDNPYSEQIIKKDIDSGKMWVMELNNKIVGYVTISNVLDTAEIERIAVHKNYQKKGYATELLNEVINHLNSLGVKEIFLEVRIDNHKAIGLYTKFGFTKLGERPNYYHDGATAVLMGKSNEVR